MRVKGSRRKERQSNGKMTKNGIAARTPSRRSIRKNPVEPVRIAANEYALRHYAVGYTSGTPRRLSLSNVELWIVPVVLTSPGYGVVGEVGVLALDASNGDILGATPREEVLSAGARLAKEKRNELDAAFRRAKTVG